MAKIPGYTDEQLAMLTEEELAGLQELADDEAAGDDDDDGGPQEEADGRSKDKPEAEDEDAGDEGDGSDDDAGGEDDTADVGDGDADGGDGGDEDAPDGTAAVAPEPEAEGGDAEDDGASAAAKPKKSGQFPEWEVPENAAERLTEITNQLDELADQFDEGDLTAREYRQQSRALENERDDIKEKRLKASMSADMTKHTFIAEAVPAFLAQHADEYPEGSTAYVSLDLAVRELQVAAAKEGRNQFDADLLEQAHAAVQKNLDEEFQRWLKRQGNTAAPDPAREKPGDPNKGKAHKDRPNPPPTLANVPAADAEDTGAGEFAHIDRLEGEEYEAALDKMTEAQRDRYLQRA